LFAAALSLSVLLGAGITSADDELQGRLLQRSDGARFIYKDGFKYAIQSVALSDDLINAIPDGDQLFAQAPPPPPPQSGLVPVGSGISVVVPQGYTVADASSGQVDLDKNNVTDIRIRVTPPQPSTGPILSAVQSELAGSGSVFVWKDVTDLPSAVEATAAVEAMLTSLEQ
jgi:hypothetical protein